MLKVKAHVLYIYIKRKLIYLLYRPQTLPGTKLLVTKPIPIQDNILLLGPGMLENLGGHVTELVQAWRAGKVCVKKSVNRWLY